MRNQHEQGMYFIHQEVRQRNREHNRWMEKKLEQGEIMEVTRGWDEMEVEGRK